MSAISPAACLIREFVGTAVADGGIDAIADRPGLAQFLRDHQLVAGPVPISPAHREEAVALRDGLRALLADPTGAVGGEEFAAAQHVLDGLRITVTLTPGDESATPFVPAVVDELRRALARIAAAWATVVSTGEWREIADGVVRG